MKHLLNRMKRGITRSPGHLAAAALVIFSAVGLSMVPGARAQTVARAADEGAEFLTRGPVHEAFAGTISFKSTPGILVPQAPPAVVNEFPPDERPDGDNVTWIPGYWVWDEDTSGFIWVSGIWRNLPPGRQWIPGYWSQPGQDYQWISGYWAGASVEEVEYLGEPPASLEAGPNIKAPSSNYTWIPGNWRWSDSRYAWQGGYWDEGQPDWVWVPSYYTSTPRGYVYVDGYYDYDVSRRGMIFAPVRFAGRGYPRPDYRYRPSVVITLGAVLNHLFLRPRSHHYYFGDYYDPQYRRSGYYSSNNYYSGGYGYDPIYAHQRWKHRDDDRWERRYEDNFTYYRDHQDERPPHTFAAMSSFFESPDRNRRVEQGYASPLDQFVNRQDNKMKYRKLDASEQQRFALSGRELQAYSDQRRNSLVRAESRPDKDRSGKGDAGREETRKEKPAPVKMPKSPVVSLRREGRTGADTPPERSPAARSVSSSKGKGESDSLPGKVSDQTTVKDSKKKTDQDPRADSKRESKGDPGKDKPDREPKGRPAPDSKRDSKADPAREPGKEKKVAPRREAPTPQPRAESKKEAKPEPKRESQAEPKRESKTEPKREPKAEPKAEPRKEPRREARAEPRKEPKAEPKREARAEPRKEPKAEPKREARAEPRKEQKAEPKREPKTEPRREAPKKESKAEPKRETKKEARPQPKQTPKAQPKAEPRQKPQAPSKEAAPSKKKSSDSDDPKEKGKDKKGKG